MNSRRRNALHLASLRILLMATLALSLLFHMTVEPISSRWTPVSVAEGERRFEVHAAKDLGSARFTRISVSNVSGPVDLPRSGMFLPNPRERNLWVNLTYRNEIQETGGYITVRLDISRSLNGELHRLTELVNRTFAWSDSTNEVDFLISIDESLWTIPTTLFLTAQLWNEDPRSKELVLNDAWGFRALFIRPLLTLQISNSRKAHVIVVDIINKGNDVAVNVSLRLSLLGQQEVKILSIGPVGNLSERSFELVFGPDINGSQKLGFRLSYYSRLGIGYAESGSALVNVKKEALIQPVVPRIAWTDLAFGVSAYLTSDGTPISGANVTIIVEQAGQKMFRVVIHTNKNGIATASVIMNSPGEAVFNFTFEGDEKNALVSTEIIIAIYPAETYIGPLLWLSIATLLVVGVFCLSKVDETTQDNCRRQLLSSRRGRTADRQ